MDPRDMLTPSFATTQWRLWKESVIKLIIVGNIKQWSVAGLDDWCGV